jgi:hypothetical protein
MFEIPLFVQLMPIFAKIIVYSIYSLLPLIILKVRFSNIKQINWLFYIVFGLIILSIIGTAVGFYQLWNIEL